MFPKIEELVLPDPFNKNNSYLIGIGKHTNNKRVYQYRTIVYHKGINFLQPLECENFKTYEAAKNFFELMKEKYSKIGKIV